MLRDLNPLENVFELNNMDVIQNSVEHSQIPQCSPASEMLKSKYYLEFNN